jgi:hypothetical protein
MNGENEAAAAAAGLGALCGGVGFLIQLAIAVLIIVSMWKIFTKAGQPGWASIIPFYNIYVLLQVAGKPGWWLILMLIPGVNIIFWIIALVGLAQNFGKGVGFILGLIFLPMIFYPILAFSNAQYLGAGAQPATP